MKFSLLVYVLLTIGTWSFAQEKYHSEDVQIFFNFGDADVVSGDSIASVPETIRIRIESDGGRNYELTQGELFLRRNSQAVVSAEIDSNICSLSAILSRSPKSGDAIIIRINKVSDLVGENGTFRPRLKEPVFSFFIR